VVAVYANGILIGGMTYRLDPDRDAPMPQDGGDDCHTDDCAGPARRLLRCLDLPDDKVNRVRLRRVGIDIEMGDC
jgi:hypothetical protein